MLKLRIGDKSKKAKRSKPKKVKPIRVVGDGLNRQPIFRSRLGEQQDRRAGYAGDRRQYC